MDDRTAETLYFERRVSDSLAMAAAAVGPCAQLAHMELARLYGEVIDALIAQPELPTFHSLFSNAAAAERATPNYRPGSQQAIPLIRRLAGRER
jgi:hypothetical protein